MRLEKMPADRTSWNHRKKSLIDIGVIRDIRIEGDTDAITLALKRG